MKEIKDYFEVINALLPVNGSLSITEYERRASEFLTALARIADWRHLLSEEKIKYTSVQLAVYAEQLFKGSEKTVTANKTIAEASAEYTAAREDLERIENDLSYLKIQYEVYLNAHLFYRQLSKETNS